MKGIAQIRQKLQIMRLLQMQIATTMMMMAVIVMTSSTKNLYPFFINSLWMASARVG